MACQAPVPAQEQAARYLEAVAPNLPCRLFVGGHSKGGNLALYAAMKASPAVQDRIELVYSHDAPGFKAGTFAPDDWNRLSGRIHRTVPQESVVGMLMETPIAPHVVKSSEHGIMQHSPFTWEVAGDDFAYLDDVADSAKFTDALISEWLARYTDSEAAAIVDALFKAIEASGAQNATDVFFGGAKTVALVTEAAKNIDGSARDTLLGALGALAEVAARLTAQGLAGAAQTAVSKLVPKTPRTSRSSKPQA